MPYHQIRPFWYTIQTVLLLKLYDALSVLLERVVLSESTTVTYHTLTMLIHSNM